MIDLVNDEEADLEMESLPPPMSPTATLHDPATTFEFDEKVLK